MSVPETKLLSISSIKKNPDNPRIIKDDKFKKLVESVKTFPQMLKFRPVVVDSDMVILGGNMRYEACKAAGHTEIPVLVADDLTEEQKREFVIKDNVSGGEWDWSALANEWDIDLLTEWGLDLPDHSILPSDDELIGEDRNKPPTMKITFESPEQLQSAENDIQEILDRKYQGAYFSISCGDV